MCIHWWWHARKDVYKLMKVRSRLVGIPRNANARGSHTITESSRVRVALEVTNLFTSWRGQGFVGECCTTVHGNRRMSLPCQSLRYSHAASSDPKRILACFSGVTHYILTGFLVGKTITSTPQRASAILSLLSMLSTCSGYTINKVNYYLSTNVT